MAGRLTKTPLATKLPQKERSLATIKRRFLSLLCSKNRVWQLSARFSECQIKAKRTQFFVLATLQGEYAMIEET